MITENLSTLKIHKLSQAQYDRELEAGRIDENALYLTPDEAVDSVNGKIGAVILNASDVGAAPASHTHSYAPDGYGLGDKDHAPVVGDWGTLNAMVQPGWYKVAFTTWRTGSHLLLVDAAHDLIVQTFIWQDGNGIISGRRCKTSSSDWTELEWIGDIDGGTW